MMAPETMVADADDYARFAAGFAFEETPDQQRAIDEVLADLAKSTPMEAWYDKHLENKSKEEEILRVQPIDFLEEEDDVGLMQCSKCHSANIAWEQKQTRGADESMTIFCQCKDCGKRWKMS